MKTEIEKPKKDKEDQCNCDNFNSSDIEIDGCVFLIALMMICVTLIAIFS